MAKQVIYAGTFLTGMALLVLPLTLPNPLLTYNDRTGVIGDTIGGIAGPILNLTGLLVVYYSLREQVKSNKKQAKQIRKEVRRNNREKFFDITLQLNDKFSTLIKDYQPLLFKLVDFNIQVDNPREYYPQKSGQYKVGGGDEYVQCWWMLQDLSQYFSLIRERLQSELLDADQHSVVIQLIGFYYGRLLTRLRTDYQRGYGSMFEHGESIKETRPECLRVIDSELSILDKLTGRNSSTLSGEPE